MIDKLIPGKFSRRDMLRAGGLGVMGLWGIGVDRRASSEENSKEPHFFLQIVIPDGLDQSYLFDARPLAMTSAGMQANYLAEEPFVWSGVNAQTTLATSLASPLARHKDCFSVINGILMASSFDGHDQNLSFLFTGNPFGGDFFVPLVNSVGQGSSHAPLDYVQCGSVFMDVANNDSSLRLSPLTGPALAHTLKQSASFKPHSSVFRFIASRMKANMTGDGRFSAASARMFDSWQSAPDLASRMQNLDLDVNLGRQSELDANLEIILQFFQQGIAKSAVLVLRPEGQDAMLDTHGADQARRSPELIGSIARQLARIFDFLRETAFDDQCSVGEVTSFLVASEFGRSMRQMGLPVDATGTDHNPLANSVLIGGKGIRSGLILGATDRQRADESVSTAHRMLDKFSLKTMGRAFDFDSGHPLDVRPDEFKEEHYLNFGSVVNSIYRIFEVDTSHDWLVARGKGKAPIIKQLLA